MIVDCHTHIDIKADEVATSEHLVASEPVDVCVVLARRGESSEETNKRLSEYVGKHREKMAGFAVVDPQSDKVSFNNVRPLRDRLGLKGAVVYCAAGGFHPAHSRAMRFYESAEELGWPVFFHNEEATRSPEAVLEYAQPYLLDEIARRFTGLKIVIGSMGTPFLDQTLAMVAKHENVYADLTIQPRRVWQIYNTVVAANEHGVMDKLLFGSGFPLSRAGECIETLLGLNMLMADTNLPTIPRANIRNIIERDSLDVLGIIDKGLGVQEPAAEGAKERKAEKAGKEETA
ncbi:MAG: amidohydrolase family protein [Phycisphaerales bacterium]|nr:MAG: amidohydrolase family protein [Phycisphaerales bacterium]